MGPLSYLSTSYKQKSMGDYMCRATKDNSVTTKITTAITASQSLHHQTHHDKAV